MSDNPQLVANNLTRGPANVKGQVSQLLPDALQQKRQTVYPTTLGQPRPTRQYFRKTPAAKPGLVSNRQQHTTPGNRTAGVGPTGQS